MLEALRKIRKAIASRVPGTTTNVALAKREMERELRAAGHSRKKAMAVTAAHFNTLREARK